MTARPRNGKIVTFYSYKGGTGRSMALANVGWILAATGHRVLLIDWDLEAPGLHRYLHPFLGNDKELSSTPGLMDFFVDFATAARVEHASETKNERWFEPSASLVRYALPVDWDFGEGALEFVGAGRQDAGYGVAVTTFNWHAFYEQLGGGVFLEVLKKRLRHDYDFVLIDSRTGISDTSGICTVQMPDELVVLFTMNRQSIKGAAAVAANANQLRRKSTREPGLRIWPVPTRIELAEKDRLDAAREECRAAFDWYIGHLLRADKARYWSRMEVLHQAYYAYEEVLATFTDKPGQTNSMLAKMEAIASSLTGKPTVLPRMPEDVRQRAIFSFQRPKKEVDTTHERPYAFVSYGQEDWNVVEALAGKLAESDVPLWIDRQSIRAGEPWAEAIRDGIERSAVVLFVIGPTQIGDLRKVELETALNSRKWTLPVLIDGAKHNAVPGALRGVHAATIKGKGRRVSVPDVRRLADDVKFFLARASTATTSLDPEDKQKGRWGGEAEYNDRALTAAVSEISSNFFAISLNVQSTTDEPLTGDVTFHLHQTFAPDVRTVQAVRGHATLQLVGWGAFTVGAVADNGRTTLELDLADDSSFPETFRER